MRLVQFELRNGERRVGVVDGTQLREVRTARSVRELALAAIEAGVGLAQQVDSLGLGDELESQMQLVVDRYECEWANALNDPAKLKRFRTFVNERGGDPDIQFVQERGQPRPAPARVPSRVIPIAEEIA